MTPPPNDSSGYKLYTTTMTPPPNDSSGYKLYTFTMTQSWGLEPADFLVSDATPAHRAGGRSDVRSEPVHQTAAADEMSAWQQFGLLEVVEAHWTAHVLISVVVDVQVRIGINSCFCHCFLLSETLEKRLTVKQKERMAQCQWHALQVAWTKLKVKVQGF